MAEVLRSGPLEAVRLHLGGATRFEVCLWRKDGRLRFRL